MSAAQRQVGILLRNALRMDFRTRATGGRERRWRAAQPFAIGLFFYIVVGVVLATSLSQPGIALHAQATLVYAVAGMLVILNLLVEYQEILLAPTDAEVLGWRPIASRTLYAARVLHVCLYVGLLSLALVGVPAVVLGGFGPAGGFGTSVAFLVGGFLNSMFATAVVLLVYGLLLRRLSADRFQDVLGNVQLLFMVAMVLGYQLLTPQILGAALGQRSGALSWLLLMPPAWFAALPSLVGAASGSHHGPALAAGLAAFALVWAYAARRLAPGYQAQIEGVRAASGDTAATPARLPAWQRVAGAWLGSQPLRRLGFDFFLAHLRGDRKIRIALMPLIAMPIGFVIAAVVLGGGADPYAAVPRGSAGGWMSGAAESAAARDASFRAQWLLFWSVYMIASLATSIGRSLSRCNDWRAAWVFHAAPLRRYDQFYVGVMWGVVGGLLLPSVALVGLMLLVIWHDPVHVAAHLALPIGLSLFTFPLSHLVDFAPPFSQEPQRGARSREVVVSLLAFLPLMAVAGLHYVLRGRPWLLICLGLALGVVAILSASLFARRLRTIFLRLTFDA